ncbi:hypothetical protein LMIY3S_03071 [Labrys miyagiensis]
MAEAQENPAVIAAIAASYLRQGKLLDKISRGLTIVGCVTVIVGAFASAPLLVTGVAALSVLFGMLQVYFALRAGFDAEIFGHLATGSFSATTFDGSMKILRLIDAERTPRPMSDRARGAMVLVRRQATVVGLQVLSILTLPVLGILL